MYVTNHRVFALSTFFFALSGWIVYSPDVSGATPHPNSAQEYKSARLDEKEKPQSANKLSKPGVLLLARDANLVILTPEGKAGIEFTAPKDTHMDFYNGIISRDRTRVAYTVISHLPQRPPKTEPLPLKVVIRKLNGGADLKDLGVPTEPIVVDLPARNLTLVWGPDDKKLLVTKETRTADDSTFEAVLVDSETGKSEPVNIPETVQVIDWSKDSKTYLVIRQDGKKRWLGLLAKDGKDVKDLTEIKGWVRERLGRFSPDGKTVLYTDVDPDQKDAIRWGLSSKPYLIDVAGGKPIELNEFPENACCSGLSWSPDGKQIAYVWSQVHPDFVKKEMIRGGDGQIETEAFLIIVDRDGKNAKTIYSAKKDNVFDIALGTVDWR